MKTGQKVLVNIENHDVFNNGISYDFWYLDSVDGLAKVYAKSPKGDLVVAVQKSDVSPEHTTEEWFKAAVPQPTIKNVKVQIGCALEEMAEFADALDEVALCKVIEGVATKYKKDDPEISINLEALRDASQDILVTLKGVYHMLGLNWEQDEQAVIASNWSKFENGHPIFNENGKIAKGRNYKEPKLVEVGEPEVLA